MNPQSNNAPKFPKAAFLKYAFRDVGHSLTWNSPFMVTAMTASILTILPIARYCPASLSTTLFTGLLLFPAIRPSFIIASRIAFAREILIAPEKQARMMKLIETEKELRTIKETPLATLHSFKNPKLALIRHGDIDIDIYRFFELRRFHSITLKDVAKNSPAYQDAIFNTSQHIKDFNALERKPRPPQTVEL